MLSFESDNKDNSKDEEELEGEEKEDEKNKLIINDKGFDLFTKDSNGFIPQSYQKINQPINNQTVNKYQKPIPYHQISKTTNNNLKLNPLKEDIIKSQNPVKTNVDGEPVKKKKKKKNKKKEINSNYGWCVFSEENGSQYDNCLEVLKKDKTTRNAIIMYNRPEIYKDYKRDGMHDMICTMYFTAISAITRVPYILFCTASAGLSSIIGTNISNEAILTIHFEYLQLITGLLYFLQ